MAAGPPAVAFVGPSGSGKTTALAAVIRLLASRGLAVGVLKLTNRPFEIDRPGTDTSVLKEAGARAVAIRGAGRFALVRDDDPPLAPDEIIRRYLADADIVLVEGGKTTALPKIEFLPPAGGPGPDVSPPVVARAARGGGPAAGGVPALDADRPEDLADFISRRFALEY